MSPASGPPAQRFPTWRALGLFLGGLALPISACFFSLVEGARNPLGELSSIVFGLLTIAGALGFLAGVVLVFMRILRAVGPERADITTDRVRPYRFYDVALSICSTCLRKIEAKIAFEEARCSC